ncbi:SMC-Scp complex subunit ScpB [Longirhabdus pacifica]|uniref:SMC-Scp complex subunit ScpB n=1 Tax=Longirhabdus pacifica TaxID=2305227 RepID=UPI001008A798|nr:SMC-Scp complex subunit ScpB [Longirhabdus pacifica]
MDRQQRKAVIEGLLFAVGDEGLDVKQLANIMDTPQQEIIGILQEMKREFVDQQRGIQLMEIAGGYQLTTLSEHAPYFQKLAHTPSRGTLSQAALETLAIIAYKQPITRIEIEEIRGVRSERALQTLVVKDLVTEVARADTIGRPILYGTTKFFLEHFGLNELQDLPNAAQFDPEDFEAEAKMLFDKLDNVEQLTFDDIEET